MAVKFLCYVFILKFTFLKKTFLTDFLVIFFFINTFTCFLSTGGVHGVECS